MDLLAKGFEVFVVADAASSRTPENAAAGVERLRAAGAAIVTTEMVVFEWMERADHPISGNFSLSSNDGDCNDGVQMTAATTPLVLLPGLLCDGALWRHQTARLGDAAAFTMGDFTHDDSIEAMARSVLIEAPETFALAGHSMGGYVALEIMRQAPGRVTRLALIDTSARPDTPEQTGAAAASSISPRWVSSRASRHASCPF